MINSTIKDISPGNRILYLFLLSLAGLFIAGLFMSLISNLFGLDAGGIAIIYISATLQSVTAFIIPAYLTVKIVNPDPIGYLRLKNEKHMPRYVALGISVFILSYAAVSFLNQWNRGITLPASMHDIEQWMRALEDSAMNTTNLLLSSDSVTHLFMNLLIVAGLAAFSEEIFFRGALQRFIQEKTKNGHLSVWIAALVFSIIHFQFYGFFPRLLLGALLGYLFLYTNNLWTPIIMHFINNATIIVLNYFWGDSEWMKNLNKMELTTTFGVMAIASAAFTFLLFRNWLKRSKIE